MGILDRPFAMEFIRTVNDGWEFGWHESNGGNLSYRLKSCERANVKKRAKSSEWKGLDAACQVPELANDMIMVTAAGSHFRSISSFPKECAGIIEIDSKGTAYRQAWGFKGSGKPTSELPTHLLIHQLKKRSGSNARVVYHAHPSKLIALSSLEAGDCNPQAAIDLTMKLWGAMSEAAIVVPEGVGLLPWMVPGSIDLGIATCKQMIDHNAVIWSHHGLIACGETFDSAFGLMHAIEKASGIALDIDVHSGEESCYISAADLKKMSSALDLDLDLGRFATIREDRPFKPSFGTIPLSL